MSWSLLSHAAAEPTSLCLFTPFQVGGNCTCRVFVDVAPTLLLFQVGAMGFLQCLVKKPPRLQSVNVHTAQSQKDTTRPDAAGRWEGRLRSLTLYDNCLPHRASSSWPQALGRATATDILRLPTRQDQFPRLEMKYRVIRMLAPQAPKHRFGPMPRAPADGRRRA